MRRRFFNAADNFVGGCYNKLSNEDIKRLGGKRPYVCQFNKIHIHIGPVLKDHDSDVSYIMFNSKSQSFSGGSGDYVTSVSDFPFVTGPGNDSVEFEGEGRLIVETEASHYEIEVS